jgi:hypothetical protein
MARAIPRSLYKAGDDPLARTRENKKTFRWVLVLCGITVFQMVSSAAVIVHDGQLEYTLRVCLPLLLPGNGRIL